MSMTTWHALPIEESVERLESSWQGLTTEAAEHRLDEYGSNVLPESSRRSFAHILLNQFKDFMILVLIAAAVISGLVGEPQDAIAIVVILTLNAGVGAFQEVRAEHAVAALRKMSAPFARVLRDQGETKLPAAKLVPGDVVLLRAGDVVPADLRLLEAVDLETDESTLTGESVAVAKLTEPLDEIQLPLGDCTNMAFKSTLVTRGRGQGIVTATGPHTEIGRIAGQLQHADELKTPLQQRLARFGRQLALVILAICAVVFTTGLLQGNPILLMFLTAVTLAVAAIPEALPAVITVSLALGARRLIHHNALVRNLPAVETLGSVTYICADKTGTLTENRMTVERLVTAGELRDTLASPTGDAVSDALGRALALNNDIRWRDGKPVGEPTELALFEAARRDGYEKRELEKRFPRCAEIPFDSARKRMTTVHQLEAGTVAYVKGAPEELLSLCTSTVNESDKQPFDRAILAAQAESLAGEGYRVLGFAQKQLNSVPEEISTTALEQDLEFLGLVALIDPPRPEVPQAVARCSTAGITPVMITGDHPATALAISKRLGIASQSSSVITGMELNEMSEEALEDAVNRLRVYARVSPDQKLRIIQALQSNGEFVAMTGDGVNDAPALNRADIGVSMGRKGTDVARAASDMVLLDDNFNSIVGAIRAGRRIYDNIRKFIKYTMTSNSGEIWTLFLAPFLGLPIPLLPIHILWINLVTDGLPGLAFSAERAEPKIMARPPRPPDETIFAHGMWQHMVWVGLFIGGISLISQAWSISQGIEHWQTVVFTVLTFSQLFQALAIRSDHESLGTLGIMSNPFMLGAVILTIALQLCVIYLPALNVIFHTQPLPLSHLAACFALSSLVLLVVEIEKWFIRRGTLYRDKR